MPLVNRFCLNKTGPLDSSLIATATTSMIGQRIKRAIKLATKSNILVILNLLYFVNLKPDLRMAKIMAFTSENG